jgi:hypothetical protein
MIVNAAGIEALDLPMESAEGEAYRRVISALEACPDPFRVVEGASGLDVAAESPIEGRPNRCRLKVFTSRPGLMIAFFYKTSSVPFSRDRYGYGGIKFAPDKLDEATIPGWLEFAARGFPTEGAPDAFKRTMALDVPPDPDPAATRGSQAIPSTPDREWGQGPARPLNASELEISLFCRGIRIADSADLEHDARLFSRTRAGLGSGLELIVPGRNKDLWVNIPVEEDFAWESPYQIRKRGDDYFVEDERRGFEYPVRIPVEPKWYMRKTTNGTPMHKIGVLQGTYLGIYISNSCGYWYSRPSQGCKFCTTGVNVGVNEVAEKDIDDVVQVALAAKEESGNTFVHFNSGYQGKKDIDRVAPYVKAIKERVGALVGVQLIPTREFEKYDWLIDLGVDHFSFCYEFHNAEYFADLLPGKQNTIGQRTFFDALEYCCSKTFKGACSGEVIAGVEPIQDTLRAIDMITSMGAFPTVCIFRPVIGAEMEGYPSPREEDMVQVMRHMYEACRRASLPIGMAPNIEVSLIVNPEDARDLTPPSLGKWWYETKLKLMRRVARSIFRKRMRARPRSAPAVFDGGDSDA